MAGVFRGQGGVAPALLLAFLFVVFASPTARSQLYEQPVLVIDPGMHTSFITDVGVDAEGKIGVTGSYDKTLRVWSLSDGKLLQTIRMPTGPGSLGKIHAVAVNPDGSLVAVGGWLTGPPEDSIYVFETRTGKMVVRIAKLSGTTDSLAFSPDGRYLAAGLSGSHGLHAYDRHRLWREAFRDSNYEGAIYGITFSADGRLATTSLDGNVRLYDRTFRLAFPPKPVHALPMSIAFSPDGALLAIGHQEAVVELLDGHSLAEVQAPNLFGLNGALQRVAWSKDGRTLYAGGSYSHGDIHAVLAWGSAGRGGRRSLPLGSDPVAGLAVLPDGSILVAAQNSSLTLLESGGSPRWLRSSPSADFRGQFDRLAVSADGTIVDFGFESGSTLYRFDLRARKLSGAPPADQQTIPAKQNGLVVQGWNVSGWYNGDPPTLEGEPLNLQPFDASRSLAIAPDNSQFVLGSFWHLHAFDATGRRIWRYVAPDVAWAVNISGDGRLVVAAYGDGTIRWHRLDDGRELLALYALADRQNWVAWTPEGFYGATAGAFRVLQWHVNRGFDAAAETVPVNTIPRLRRPDALALVLQELETVRALGVADLKAARRDVQIVTGSAKAPGARLHVLTIGISNYGDKARNLSLNFAARDAHDVASALLNTQESGLYAEIKLMILRDGEADKAGIFEALAGMDRNMKSSAGRDLAVV
ncbi:MAG TPA: WD40 repeat domain-containing protein, partial [Pseudolabrys sp.]|nr:WD40 repeat domain-containing protein [Pseudolabrys sp.]